jgi:hypothetical protein
LTGIAGRAGFAARIVKEMLRMGNVKIKVGRLAALLGCALALGLLVGAAPVQARAATPPPDAAAAAQVSPDGLLPPPGSSGSFEIIGAYTNGYCLGIKGGSTTPGTPAVLWNCNGNPDQQWRWVHVTSGYGELENGHNDCLGINAGNDTEGNYLVAFTCYNNSTTHPDQFWTEVAAPSGCSGGSALGDLDGGVAGTKGGSVAENTEIVIWNYQVKCNNQIWI